VSHVDSQTTLVTQSHAHGASPILAAGFQHPPTSNNSSFTLFHVIHCLLHALKLLVAALHGIPQAPPFLLLRPIDHRKQQRSCTNFAFVTLFRTFVPMPFNQAATDAPTKGAFALNSSKSRFLTPHLFFLSALEQ